MDSSDEEQQRSAPKPVLVPAGYAVPVQRPTSVVGLHRTKLMLKAKVAKVAGGRSAWHFGSLHKEYTKKLWGGKWNYDFMLDDGKVVGCFLDLELYDDSPTFDAADGSWFLLTQLS